MISYQPFFDTLKRKGISSYRLGKMGFALSNYNATRYGKNISTRTINSLCRILKCNVSAMASLSDKTCCFTGHRELLGPTDVIVVKIERAILKVLDHNVVYYGVGGAFGFDMLALETLIRMRDEDKLRDIKIIMVAPFEGYMNFY